MTEMSSSPLVKKLGIKPGYSVATENEPEGFRDLLVGLPDDIQWVDGAAKMIDLVLLFTTTAKNLKSRLIAWKKQIHPAGGVWIIYPKKSSKVPTDVTFEVVQPIGLALGMVDNKICAVDSTWTALRFVIRVENRPKSVGK
jgi:hypothetical protein